MNVVTHLLAAVPVHGVALPGDRAAHQVGEEAVQPRPRVVGAGEAAAAKADRRDAEITPVLLDEQICGRLRHAEERVERLVDRHRRGNAVVVLVLLGQFQARLVLDERQ